MGEEDGDPIEGRYKVKTENARPSVREALKTVKAMGHAPPTFKERSKDWGWAEWTGFVAVTLFYSSGLIYLVVMLAIELVRWLASR